MNKLQTLDAFWNSFGWPAYNEYSVPDDVEYPYITYNVVTSDLDYPVSTYANIWDRSSSWENISLKMLDIERYITTMNPPAIKFDTGRLYITKGNPFSERMQEPNDEMVKRIYINVSMEYFSSY